MSAASQRVGVHGTSAAAIRRAAAAFEDAALNAANDRFDADEAFEAQIDAAMTDADLIDAVVELGLEITVEAKARDIVADRLRKGVFA